MKQKFNVEGMHCASCSSRIENVLNNVEGVHSCSVNLLQNSMLVEYDESIQTDINIIERVQSIGFGVNIEMKKKDKSEENKSLLTHKKRVLHSFLVLIPLMYIAMGPMFSLPLPSIINMYMGMYLYVTLQLVLTTLILWMHKHYFINGIHMLIKRSPTMDSLIALGAGAAFGYSTYLWINMGMDVFNNVYGQLHTYAHNLYFESAAMIVTLISLGKYLEEKAKHKTSDAVSKLMDLAADSAIVIRDGKEIEIHSEDILVGDILVIKPGYSIPVDGILVEGVANIDESSMSGESIPVEKKENDTIISGTFNINTTFTMKATRVKEDTTIAQIIQLVEEATTSKPNIAKLADKVSGVFVPIVITIAIVATVVWLLLGYSFSFALSIGIAVLVISCPCALGLATPTAIMVGSGKAAENKILMKRSESLEKIHEVDIIVFDKTGTITNGKPEVVQVITHLEEETFIQIGASLETGSEHPLSTAIINYAKQKEVSLLKNTSFENMVGKGAKATLQSTTYYAGNKALMIENNISTTRYEEQVNILASSGKIPIYVANESEVLGIFALSDTIKPTSLEAIKTLQGMNKKVYMITGDNQLVAKSLQQELQLDAIHAEVIPQDKENIIANLQSEGHVVMMVGDGVNDAPALSRADVGVAIGAGSDIALECADVILVKTDLYDVVHTITLSHAVIKNIKQNLFWAFFYNVVGIPLAAGVLYLPFQILLNPMFGAAAMSLSSVCVVSNALRLKRLRMEKRAN